jgi:uncharacterized protein (TIGR02757 family)
MMTKETEEQLRQWAERYNTLEFIAEDPVQFPHRYKNSSQQDVEISGFLTAYLSFGNRKQIVKACNILDELMGKSPHRYVMSRRWATDFFADNEASFYRMISYAKMNDVFSRLYEVYSAYSTLEMSLLEQQGPTPFDRLCSLFGMSNKSPQKKMNMFLRWMIRNDGIVDFGLWKNFSPAELIIPLDTHVCRMAYLLGITSSKVYSLANAKTITEELKKIFPSDPCLGDFALFGYGVENKQ